MKSLTDPTLTAAARNAVSDADAAFQRARLQNSTPAYLLAAAAFKRASEALLAAAERPLPHDVCCDESEEAA